MCSENDYTSSVAPQNLRSLPSPTSANMMPISGATLTDPKGLENHLANGISPKNFHYDSSKLPPRQSSEPPPARLFNYSSTPTSSMDDAYHVFHRKGHSKSLANYPNPIQPRALSFDPRQLLDPKRFNSASIKNGTDATASEVMSPPARAESESINGPLDQFPDNRERGMGTLIEQVYNINPREDRPRKKQKTDNEDESEKKQVTFTGGGSAGEIGEYMKQKRKEGQELSGPTNTVVDLTGADDDDDEVVVTKESNDKEVCYGRLDKTKVQAHAVPYPSAKATYLGKNEWPSMKVQLGRFPGSDNIIRVMDPTGKDFGNVDVKTSLGLRMIMDCRSPKFRTQARLNLRKKKPGEIAGSPCSEYFDMTINLYGPKSKVITIGRFLSQKQIFLRTPFMVDHGYEVCNPHEQKNGNLSMSRTPGISATGGYVSRTIEEIRSDVLGMFDSLEKSENLPEMEPNPMITTILLVHQKQGLHFMTNKERDRVFSEKEEGNSSLWRLRTRPNGQVIYYDVITGKEERSKPPEVLGGILADMMGLGKTLSILSLIVGSLDKSLEWENQMPSESEEGHHLVRNSKSTLLVSPLSTIANWEEQVAAHIKPGSLKYYVYHGGNRCQDINELAKYDIVITTYSIVSSEFNGRGKRKSLSPLLKTNFFRIVLDEAHMIREQGTIQSQAICSLSAQRRWAVTGTPVQNKLDDLGALIKFLRVKPFSDKGGFAQHILSPFKNADPEILPKLRLLVDTITLRRLKDRIDLPARHDQIVRLPFSDDENELYQWFARYADKKMRIIAGEERKSLGGKAMVHILQAIMRLRLICAHGRELLSEEDLKLLEGHSWNNAINLEDEEENDKPILSARQAYEMLMLFRETDQDTCAQCARKIGQNDSENALEGHEDIIGYMLSCYQMVCNECMKDLNVIFEQNEIEGRLNCPFCDQQVRTAFFELNQSGIEAAEDARIQVRENPRRAKIMGRYGGPHTKTRALIESLQLSRKESEDLPSDKPIKSVVFSGWTAHLNLIQIALEDHKFKYVRLDGQMSRAKRTAALDAFHDDPDVTVIIISITAGGLGLNLTTASKVYVMEPQFNPAAEAQAVDRVHRLGQTREVYTTRFIMQDSFEEKMLNLQRKKENLADLSMSRGKLDRAEAARQKMEELRSLFR